MEWYFTDENRIDTCSMSEFGSVDIEIGRDENTFEVEIPAEQFDASMHILGGYFYSPGTEYGGRIDRREIDTSDNTIKLGGQTWRGLLQQRVVSPPAGADYAAYGGDLNDVISQVIGSKYGDLFTVETADSGTYISGLKARYDTILEVLTRMCEGKGYRLDIECVYMGDGIRVKLSAKPVVDHSDEVEVSQDSNVSFVLTEQEPEIDYMICAGQGELKNRLIRIINRQGSVVAAIPDGVEVKTVFYDYPNAESEEELLNSARDRLKEAAGGSEQRVMVDSENDVFALGDIVGGRDYITGAYLASPIESKIIKYSSGSLNVEYKVAE